MKAPGGRNLLMALGGPPADLGQLVATRKQELYSAKYPRVRGVRARNLSVSEIALVLFAESQVHSRHVPRTSIITTLVTTSGMPALVSRNQ